MNYAEVYSKLGFETATLVFLKKDGAIRIMLATRNMHTIQLVYGFKGKELGGHDNRCNINNGNLAVFDMIVGEARSFSIDRLVSIEYHGIISDNAGIEHITEEYTKFKHEYEINQPKELTMDMLDRKE